MENDTSKQQKNKETLDSDLFNFLSGDFNISMKDISSKIDNYQNSLLLDQYPLQKNQKLFSKILANSPKQNMLQTKQFLYSIANFDQSSLCKEKENSEVKKLIKEEKQDVNSIEDTEKNDENFQDTISNDLLKRIHKVKYFWRKTNPSYPFTFMKQEYDEENDEIVYSEDYSNKKVSPFD